MNWITVLLILIFAGQIGIFAYLLYLVWKEFAFTIKDSQRLSEPIANLVQEGKRLQLIVDAFSVRMNYVMAEAREVIEIGRDTSDQVKTLVATAATLRSPNVKLAVRYGRDWIEERRMNPIMRTLKRTTRKVKKKFRKMKERLQDD
jgi:hypothetical protein